MNKKFLSAVLFGTLMVTSTGTFVSCKDYDDDIDEINKELSDIKSQIAALQTEVSSGNWVTNLTPIDGGFTVTFKNGASYSITNGKDGADGKPGADGQPGADGKGTELKVTEDGYWEINGKKSPYLAVTEDDLKEVKVPYVNGDKMWVFFDKDGNEVVSEYNANGATYAVEVNGVWTLNIPDANGEMQAVELPTAGSMISEIEILDGRFQYEVPQNIALSYWLANKTTKWEGPKGNIKDKSVLYGSNDKIYTRIAPVTVDATELDFQLVDSKGGVAPISLATPVSYNEYITRAASGNGLYTIGVESKAYIYSNSAADFTAQFLHNGATKGYALKPTTSKYTSLYNVKVNATKQIVADLGYVLIQDKGQNSWYWIPLESKDYTINGKQGTTSAVKVEYPDNLYDLYLSVSKADEDLFGIKFSDDKRSFTITKTPDTITDASFTLYVHTLSNLGGDSEIKTTEVKVNVNRTMGDTTYETQIKALTKTQDKFNVSATQLTNALGADLNAWYASVNKDQIDVRLYNDAVCTDASSEGTVVVSMLKNDNDAVSKAEELKNLKFAVDVTGNSPLKIGKTYYAKVTFKDKNTNNELNSIVVPFKLTKPELSTILVKESGVFLNGGNVASAYMYAVDAKWDATAVTDNKYKSRYYIDRAFTDMDTKLRGYGITNAAFAPADGTVAYDKNTDALATISSATVNNVKRHYVELKDVDVNGDGVSMDGYKKNLNVKFTGHYLNVQDDSYKYEATYQFCVMSPIKEGKLFADNNLVKVSATGKTQITAKNVWAQTYNGEVTYGIFRTTEKDATTSSYKAAWARPDIKTVTFSSSNKNIFEMVEGKATPLDPEFKTDGTITKASYIEVEGVAAGKAKLNANILDIWGYSLVDSVEVEATVSPAN